MNTPLSWSWTFEGGNPATSTSQNPLVRYTNIGTYAVTLTATNAVGNNTVTKTGYITVSNNIPVIALTDWIPGLTNNKIGGKNRLMTVLVMGESTTDFAATSVMYGGQAMTKQVDKMQTDASRSYTGIFTLNEAGVNAATSGAIVVTWSATPSSGNSIYSVLLGNVDQTIPVFASASNGLTGTTVATSPLAAANGDMIIMCGATANNNTVTFNNGYTSNFESNSSWGDGIGGSKMGSGVSETPSFTQSASGRMALCAIVVKSASASTSLANNIAENGVNIYPNPVSKTLNLEFQDGEKNREIKVINSLGQVVCFSKTSNSTVQLDVESLKFKGLVVVQIITNKVVSNYSVLVK
jgi:PKD repeat protein